MTVSKMEADSDPRSSRRRVLSGKNRLTLEADRTAQRAQIHAPDRVDTRQGGNARFEGFEEGSPAGLPQADGLTTGQADSSGRIRASSGRAPGPSAENPAPATSVRQRRPAPSRRELDPAPPWIRGEPPAMGEPSHGVQPCRHQRRPEPAQENRPERGDDAEGQHANVEERHRVEAGHILGRHRDQAPNRRHR